MLIRPQPQSVQRQRTRIYPRLVSNHYQTSTSLNHQRWGHRHVSLFCWILNMPDDPFLVIVGVEVDRKVDDLKGSIKLIMDYPPFPYPKVLRLWKVGAPCVS